MSEAIADFSNGVPAPLAKREEESATATGLLFCEMSSFMARSRDDVVSGSCPVHSTERLGGGVAATMAKMARMVDNTQYARDARTVTFGSSR